MLTQMIPCLLYILAGLLLDFIITFHFRCVANGKRYLAAITTFVYIVLNFLILGQILTNQNLLRNTVCYALGSAIGSLLATGKPQGEE